MTKKNLKSLFVEENFQKVISPAASLQDLGKEVESADYKNWQEGALIQDALPYLTTDQRELLISATCGTCWDDMFGEEDEE